MLINRKDYIIYLFYVSVVVTLGQISHNDNASIFNFFLFLTYASDNAQNYYKENDHNDDFNDHTHN